MEERRRLKRKYLAFFTRVFDQQTGDLLGHLADITPAGLMIISEKSLPTGQTCVLRMDLPIQFFATDHILLHGKSIWCQPDIDPSFWNTGFSIHDLSPLDTSIIEKIVQEFAIRD